MTGENSDKLERLLFYAYLLFAIAGSYSRAAGQLSLGVALALFIVYLFTRRENLVSEPIRLVYIAALLYVAWLVLAGLLSSTGTESVWVTRKEWLFFSLPIGLALLGKQSNRDTIIKALSIAVVLGAVYGMIQFVTGTDWLHFEGSRLSPQPIALISGTIFSTATYANYYAAVGLFLMGLAAFGSKSWGKYRWWLFGAALASLVASTLAGERGPTIAIAVCMLIIALWRKGTFRTLAIGAILIVALASLLQPGMVERYRKIVEVEWAGTHEGSRHFIWKNSLEILETTPLFGVGNGNFMAAYREHVGPSVPPEYRPGHAHNDFINVAMAGGIPASLFFALLWGTVLWLLVKGIRNKELPDDQRAIMKAVLVASIGYLMISLAECPFATEETHELILFLWALGLASGYKKSPVSPGN